MKNCVDCGVLFIEHNPRKRLRCDPCRKVYTQRYNLRRQMADYYRRPGFHAERNRLWRQANPDRIKHNYLQWAYGITLEQYQAMLEKQHHRCGICAKPMTKKMRRVDHNHETKIVRGILCPPCNRALGWLGRRRTVVMGYLGW